MELWGVEDPRAGQTTDREEALSALFLSDVPPELRGQASRSVVGSP